MRYFYRLGAYIEQNPDIIREMQSIVALENFWQHKIKEAEEKGDQGMADAYFMHLEANKSALLSGEFYTHNGMNFGARRYRQDAEGNAIGYGQKIIPDEFRTAGDYDSRDWVHLNSFKEVSETFYPTLLEMEREIISRPQTKAAKLGCWHCPVALSEPTLPLIKMRLAKLFSIPLKEVHIQELT